MVREIVDNPSGWSRSLPGHSIEYMPGFVLPWNQSVVKNVTAGSYYDFVITFLDTAHIYFIDTIQVSPSTYTNVSVLFNVGAVMHGRAAGSGVVNLSIRDNPSLYFIAGDVITVRGYNLDSSTRSLAFLVLGTKVSRSPEFGHSPSAKFTLNTHAINAGQSVVATDASLYVPTSWIWEWGDGSADSTAQNPTHTYNTPGSYYPRLKAINQYGFDYYAEYTPVVVS